MEESQKRLIKISKIIRHTTTIAMLIFALMGLASLITAFFPYEKDELKAVSDDFINNVNLLPTDIIRKIYGETNYRLQIILSGISFAVFTLVIIFLITFLTVSSS